METKEMKLKERAILILKEEFQVALKGLDRDQPYVSLRDFSDNVMKRLSEELGS